MLDKDFLAVALGQAHISASQGGVPIGAALVIDGELVSVGHNRRFQDSSPTLHAEIDCLEKAGRQPASAYARATMFTTLSPCDMCTGALLLYKIPRVVIGENRNFMGAEDLLRSRGVEVVVADDPSCVEIMEEFIANSPELWSEDIGTIPEQLN